MTQGSALCRYMDIIALHHIGIREMHVTEADGQQEAVVLLKGNTGQGRNAPPALSAVQRGKEF